MAMRSGTVLRRRTLFEEAVEIIEREYASDLELDAVARRLATSRRQLQRAFAEAGQTSFRTHLAEVRMRRALEMLRDGSLPVREVAGRVGYRQAAQFAKTFRRHHGRPPSSFRREGRGADDGGPPDERREPRRRPSPARLLDRLELSRFTALAIPARL